MGRYRRQFGSHPVLGVALAFTLIGAIIGAAVAEVVSNRGDSVPLIGPDSAWFWVMLQFVALALTLLYISQQLRTQRSSTVVEQMAGWTREWNEESFEIRRLALLLDMQGRDPKDGLPVTAAPVANYFERIGYLVARGHVKPEDVWHDFRSTSVFYWTLLSPCFPAARTSTGITKLYEWFDSLHAEMRRIDQREHQLEGVASAEQIAADAAAGISSITAHLRLIHDVRAGILPPSEQCLRM